jgi:hypothetical protein
MFGSRFIETTSSAYANGASLHPQNLLELSTGVTLIQTGAQASIFEPVVDYEIISL